jgi:hypothetical protein
MENTTESAHKVSVPALDKNLGIHVACHEAI